MASQYTTSSGVTLKIPGAYAETQVVAANSTLAANGILMVLGESDSGPSYAEEDDITLNAFGPDQKSDVVAKYGSGQIVDAFVGACSASNDDGIKGSFTRMVIAKTNTSVAASGTINKIGGGVYGTLQAKSAGSAGNLISRVITAETAEVVPSTGAFVLCSAPVATTMSVRVNGGAVDTTANLAGMTPAAMKVEIDTNLTGVAATGGVARTCINTTRDVSVGAIAGYSCSFTFTSALTVTPTVGDILFIPTGSDFTADSNANEGTYVVTSATSLIVTATKILDAAAATRTAPSVEGPVTVGPSEWECWSPITISLESGAVVPGQGKSLEIADTSTGVFSDLCWVYTASTSTLAAATFVSKSGTPVVISSSAEYEVNLNTVRQRDGISEEIIVGGSPVLSIGYKGTTASAVIASGVMTITLTGGGSVGLSPMTVTLSDFPTIGDLTQYLGSFTDFTAAPTLVTYTSLSPLRLDEGTYTFASEWGAKTGRIKTDGADFLDAVNSESTLVDLIPPGVATTVAGLPDVASIAFLSGGSRGATTNTSVQGALDALQAVKGNLLIPLFSNNASVDIAAGQTAATSTYDIASINSACRAHCLQMSQLKRRRRRIAILSNRDTFANNQIAAANLASSRCVCTFQDVTDNNALGTLTQFKPWMTAIKAGAMQAAGFYKDITWKYCNISAATVPGGGFNYNLDSNLEDALDAGLLPITYDGSGFKWVSDQTTYSIDDNFVFNSLQAMYALDLVAATAEERMGRAFTGQSLADVSATTAITVFGAIMDDIKRLKLIASSDDAVRGFKNVVIKIVNGNAMLVSCEIKLTTSIKFVPMFFMVTAIQQTATG